MDGQKTKDLALRADKTPAKSELFRREAIENQQTQSMGTVMLAPSISQNFFVLFAVVAVAAIGSLLYLSDYARKEKVSGWLVPDQGLIKIYPPQQSVVTDLNVSNGDEVEKDAVLLALSSEQQSLALGATQEEIVRGLKARRQSLIEERKLTGELHEKQHEAMLIQMETIAQDLELRAQELEIQREQVAAASTAYERLRPLAGTGAVTQSRIDDVNQERYTQLSQLQVLERARAQAKREYASLEAGIAAAPLQNRILLSQFDRNIATIDQEIAEAEARRQVVMLAPQPGVITSLQTELGGSSDPRVPLLSIIPKGSQLQAELFIPSKARGFIREGQRVLLRYQAFPYQKFGHYEGVVSEIALSAIPQADLARRLPGIEASTVGAEPVYLVKVTLNDQHATAYGEKIALQPGMKLEAHIEIDKRKLYEWFFEPLITITG